MTDTATRPPATLLDEPLPEELHPAPPSVPAIEQSYAMVPIDAIKANPDNPRSDLGDLDGLVASIRAGGIQQALAVEWSSPPMPYLLLAGHRRLAAAKLAGLTEVPCLVRQVASTAADRMKIALVENLMREGLAPLDEAAGYLQLQKLGMSQREIAEQVGCSQSHVSKRMGLLDLSEPVRTQVGKGTITLEAAAALARLKDHPEKMEQAARAASIISTVEQFERDIAWEAKRSDLVAGATEKGWAVIDAPQGPYLVRSFATLVEWSHSGPDLDLDAGKHEAEPCHGMMIPTERRWPDFDNPVARPVCTEPARHAPKGKSKLKAKVQPKAPDHSKERAEEKKRQALAKQTVAAGAARRAVLAKAVADHKAPRSTSPALTLSLRALVRVAIEWDLHDPTCALLGIDPEEGETGWPLERYVAGGADELHRAALAVAVVEVEERLSSWGSWEGDQIAEHFAFLKTLGYELSPFETAKLDKGAGDD